MSIKPDYWIEKMAREYGMIEPFESSQVKEGVISYGVSSYGYDIRVADEFKIFTNVNTTVVDPKQFDNRSFVEFKGDICTIPPNSFALARTVEYFRIPRNVLTLCVGKSTYARCFRGDTRVALVDGTAPTLEEMARRAEDGEMFWGYSIGENGRMIVALLDAPRYVGHDSLVEVVLDTGQSIFCTPDHPFMLRDGQWLEAGNLRPGTSLMPLYRVVMRGYEMVYQPLNGHFYPTHRMTDEWNLRHGVYADLPNTHRHHVDFERRNNNPWNIVRMDASAHIRLHNAESYGPEFDPDEHSASIREGMEKLSQDPEWSERYAELQSLRARQFWHSEAYTEIRQRVLEGRRNPTEATRQAHREAMLRRYSDPAERARQSALIKAIWAKDDGTRRQQQMVKLLLSLDEIPRPDDAAEVAWQALNQAGSIRGAARLLNCDRSVFRRFPDVLKAFRGHGKELNHKVVAVHEVPGDHDVFCLTVPETGNFALENEVFVHNCGIIVNVTPFEPEWEGFVTLEISNTTPLPARIYANEGIAQVIFFEANEVCRTSYADKKGKYQKQQGITLPKVG